jgi:hypothetical protein
MRNWDEPLEQVESQKEVKRPAAELRSLVEAIEAQSRDMAGTAEEERAQKREACPLLATATVQGPLRGVKSRRTA